MRNGAKPATGRLLKVNIHISDFNNIDQYTEQETFEMGYRLYAMSPEYITSIQFWLNIKVAQYKALPYRHKAGLLKIAKGINLRPCFLKEESLIKR